MFYTTRSNQEKIALISYQKTASVVRGLENFSVPLDEMN